ncbi:MAG: RsmB/NOP family class I SAM-dependent RNA methyltransferase [Lentisphaerae bacterium]|nr:MAG: RsmB/NOP family class I SAM-dependent RNA methyltransferase [Lentisphaerota bacterium]
MKPGVSEKSVQLKNRALCYARVTAQVLKSIFTSRNPADRELRSYFKQHREHGSRDRRIIANCLFAAFRWWGWLKIHPQLSPWERVAEASDDELLKSEQQALICLAAQWLDGIDEDIELWPIWAETAGVPVPEPLSAEADLTSKAVQFAEWLDLSAIPDARALVPDWIWDEIQHLALSPEKVISAFNRRPPLWIRCQHEPEEEVLEELRRHLVTPEASPLPGAYSLGFSHVNLYLLPPFKQGWFEIQDFASQVIGYATGASPGERWWDACAGAGGKSLQLAWMMRNRGRIIASDIRAYKLKDLRRRARRGQFFNIMYKPWERTRIPVSEKTFDGVLVDAPCSCSGTWRRNPDARWTSPPDITHKLATVQYDILTKALKAVKPGGKLVYATCSICRTENEDVVCRFLRENPAFQLQPVRHPLTGKMEEFIHIYPWDYDCDGSFVVVMQKNSNDSGA